MQALQKPEVGCPLLPTSLSPCQTPSCLPGGGPHGSLPPKPPWICRAGPKEQASPPFLLLLLQDRPLIQEGGGRLGPPPEGACRGKGPSTRGWSEPGTPLTWEPGPWALSRARGPCPFSSGEGPLVPPECRRRSPLLVQVLALLGRPLAGRPPGVVSTPVQERRGGFPSPARSSRLLLLSDFLPPPTCTAASFLEASGPPSLPPSGGFSLEVLLATRRNRRRFTPGSQITARWSRAKTSWQRPSPNGHQLRRPTGTSLFFTPPPRTLQQPRTRLGGGETQIYGFAPLPLRSRPLFPSGAGAPFALTQPEFHRCCGAELPCWSRE